MQIAHEYSIGRQIARTRKWDLRFIADAMVQARHSKDPSTKVGAVIIRPDGTPASQGFNGFPRGVEDTDERLNDRATKYALVVHAEANAIVTAKESLVGCTIYTTMPACSSCAGLIIQAGIKRAVSIEPTEKQRERWGESFQRTQTMFEEAGVTQILYPKEEVIAQARSEGLVFLTVDDEAQAACECGGCS